MQKAVKQGESLELQLRQRVVELERDNKDLLVSRLLTRTENFSSNRCSIKQDILTK